MEVIKMGKIPPTLKRRKKCKNCKSELIYTDDDIKIAEDIEGICFAYFNCPVCEEELYPSLFDKAVKYIK